jgi:hypothetical protein
VLASALAWKFGSAKSRVADRRLGKRMIFVRMERREEAVLF